GGAPSGEGRPWAVRVRLYMLRPTSPGERRRTGAWWQRSSLAPPLCCVTSDSTVWEEWPADPEQFHWDELIWKLRAPRLKALYDRARRGKGVEAAVVEPSTGITAERLDRFWNRFLPAATV